MQFSNQQVELNSISRAETLSFTPLAQHAHWENIIVTLLFVLPITVIASLIAITVEKIPQPVAFTIVSVACFVLLYSIWYAYTSVKRTGIAIREHDFVLKRGIFWQKLILVPFNRIQHIETHRNPIERKMALASIKLFTAGGMGADLAINGLEVERAEDIRQFILDKVQGEQYDNE